MIKMQLGLQAVMSSTTALVCVCVCGGGLDEGILPLLPPYYK